MSEPSDATTIDHRIGSRGVWWMTEGMSAPDAADFARTARGAGLRRLVDPRDARPRPVRRRIAPARRHRLARGGHRHRQHLPPPPRGHEAGPAGPGRAVGRPLPAGHGRVPRADRRRRPQAGLLQAAVHDARLPAGHGRVPLHGVPPPPRRRATVLGGPRAEDARAGRRARPTAPTRTSPPPSTRRRPGRSWATASCSASSRRWCSAATRPRRGPPPARRSPSTSGCPNYFKNWFRLGFTEADLADGGSDRLVDALVAWGIAGPDRGPSAPSTPTPAPTTSASSRSRPARRCRRPTARRSRVWHRHEARRESERTRRRAQSAESILLVDAGLAAGWRRADPDLDQLDEVVDAAKEVVADTVVLADASLKWSLPDDQQERFERYRGTATVLCAPGGTKGGHHAFLATVAARPRPRAARRCGSCPASTWATDRGAWPCSAAPTATGHRAR